MLIRTTCWSTSEITQYHFAVLWTLHYPLCYCDSYRIYCWWCCVEMVHMVLWQHRIYCWWCCWCSLHGNVTAQNSLLLVLLKCCWDSLHGTLTAQNLLLMVLLKCFIWYCDSTEYIIDGAVEIVYMVLWQHRIYCWWCCWNGLQFTNCFAKIMNECQFLAKALTNLSLCTFLICSLSHPRNHLTAMMMWVMKIHRNCLKQRMW